MKEKICAIILNWNGWADTLDCLTSIYTSFCIPFLTIVVDNGSTDNSISNIIRWSSENSISCELISEESDPLSFPDKPALFLLSLPENRGFSGGNNTALKIADNFKEIKYFWILNNDCIVKNNSLSSLISFSGKTGIPGIFGSTITQFSNPESVEYAGGASYNPLTSRIKKISNSQKISKILQEINISRLDYIAGCAMFIHRDIFRKCGYFNESFFLYYEEIDLCMRARENGFAIAWCPNSIITHKGGLYNKNYNKVERQKLKFLQYHENLSTFLFTKQWYPFYLPIVIFIRLGIKPILFLQRKNLFLLFSLLAAFYDFIKGENKKDNINNIK